MFCSRSSGRQSCSAACHNQSTSWGAHVFLEGVSSPPLHLDNFSTAGTLENTLLSNAYIDGLLHWSWRNWWAVSIDQRRFSLLIQLWDIQRVLVSIERLSSAYYGQTIQSSRRTQTSTTKASENLFCLETFQLSSHLSAIVGAKWENLLLASNRPPASD